MAIRPLDSLPLHLSGKLSLFSGGPVVFFLVQLTVAGSWTWCVCLFSIWRRSGKKKLYSRLPLDVTKLFKLTPIWRFTAPSSGSENCSQISFLFSFLSFIFSNDKMQEKVTCSAAAGPLSNHFRRIVSIQLKQMISKSPQFTAIIEKLELKNKFNFSPLHKSPWVFN